MNTKQVAKELGITTVWALNYFKTGKIKAKKIKSAKNNEWFIEEKDFDEYLLSRKIKPPKWYYRCRSYPVNPVPEMYQSLIAEPWQVCIKNVLPYTNFEDYKKQCETTEKIHNIMSK